MPSPTDVPVGWLKRLGRNGGPGICPRGLGLVVYPAHELPPICECISLAQVRTTRHLHPSFQGLNLYVVTGIAAMLVQTLILRRDAVRRILRIQPLPKIVDAKPVTFQESIVHLKKKWFREQNRIARERAEKEWAGSGDR